jgi:dCTP deaminase
MVMKRRREPLFVAIGASCALAPGGRRGKSMILSRTEIDRCVADGSITISPYSPAQLNPTSYSYRLGLEISELNAGDPAGEQGGAVVEIGTDGMLLQPGRLYLSHTYEVIGSREYVVTLMGRPSIGRLGLFVQLSADLGNIGDAHRWTLELTCVQPIVIYPRMLIGELTFWETSGERMYYSGPYTRFSRPTGNVRDLS